MKQSPIKYQIADINNGPFGSFYSTLTEAEAALAEAIKEGQAINDSETPEGYEVPDASKFFCIVDAATGKEVRR